MIVKIQCGANTYEIDEERRVYRQTYMSEQGEWRRYTNNNFIRDMKGIGYVEIDMVYKWQRMPQGL